MRKVRPRNKTMPIEILQQYLFIQRLNQLGLANLGFLISEGRKLCFDRDYLRTGIYYMMLYNT